MIYPALPIAQPRSLRGGLGFVFLAVALSSCARRGISYPELINLVANNECPRAELGATEMLVAFVTRDTTRFVRYPPQSTQDLDSSTLFQLGSLTTAFLVPELVDDMATLGLTLDSVALYGGGLVGPPWSITYGDLLLHHTGLAPYDGLGSGNARSTIESKYEHIARTPKPTSREFRFDHWNYTLARVALSKRLPADRGDLRSRAVIYVDRADTTVRQRLAPSEAERPVSPPRQPTELFVASTGGMASAAELVSLVGSLSRDALRGLPAKPTTREGTEVTLGWYRSALKNGNYVYTNAGRTRRHGAAVAFYPATGTGVIVLAADSKPVDCLALDLLRNVNDDWKRRPDTPFPSSVPTP